MPTSDGLWLYVKAGSYYARINVTSGENTLLLTTGPGFSGFQASNGGGFYDWTSATVNGVAQFSVRSFQVDASSGMFLDPTILMQVRGDYFNDGPFSSAGITYTSSTIVSTMSPSGQKTIGKSFYPRVYPNSTSFDSPLF